MPADPLNALFYPFVNGFAVMPVAARILIINGQACAGIEFFRNRDVIAHQNFRPFARQLDAAGWKTSPILPGEKEDYDAVLINGLRQHEENIFLMAAGLRALKTGGLIVCAAANDAGGRRLTADAASLGLACREDSKYRSRIIWAEKPLKPDESALDAAIRAGAIQPVLNGQFLSCPGLFCWNRVDEGSGFLAEILPPLAGRGADFGCGWGYLSRQILNRSGQNITTLYGLDADYRAVDCYRRNMGSLPIIHALWVDIADKEDDVPQNLDWIVTNPPFHEGKATMASLGQAFIARASSCLRQEGELWMVANAHLPYEKTLARHFRCVETVAARGGFKVFRGVK